MDETLDAGGDLDERAVGGEVDDLALHARADRELVLDGVPRIGHCLLEAERNALALAVDVEHHDVELLADLDDLARVLDARPAHVGDVEETVDRVLDGDERAEVGDVLHAALADLALLERGEELGLLLGLDALDELAAGNDEVAPLVGNLDDLEVVGLPDVGLEVLDGSDFDLAAGEERLHVVDLDEETAPDRALDRTGDDAPFDVALEDLLPADLFVRGALGEDDHAGLVVLELAEHYGYLVAGLDFGAFAEFGDVDRPLGLVADVDKDFVALDCADGAFYEAAVLELRLLPCLGEKLRHRGGLFSLGSRLSDCHLFFTLVCWCSRFSAASAPSLGAEVDSIPKMHRGMQSPRV